MQGYCSSLVTCKLLQAWYMQAGGLAEKIPLNIYYFINFYYYENYLQNRKNKYRLFRILEV